jgi:hypothetical protein
MKPRETLTEADLEKADAEAVMAHYLHGKPIDPEVSARVQARAEKITEWALQGGTKAGARV